MTPTVTFLAETVQESNLKKTTVYRYYPIPEMKDKIIGDVKQHLNSDLTEYDTIEVSVQVIMKQNNKTKPVRFWYEDEQRPKDDTKNT